MITVQLVLTFYSVTGLLFFRKWVYFLHAFKLAWGESLPYFCMGMGGKGGSSGFCVRILNNRLC